MKTILTAIVAFALGVAATSFVCAQLRRTDDTARKSAVDMPTRAMIVVINNDLRSNRIEQAHAKMRKLEEKYLAFGRGGATPEMFYGEVIATEE